MSLHKTRDPHLCLHEAEGWTDGEQTEKSPRARGGKIKQGVYQDAESKDWELKLVSLEFD